MSLPTSRKDDSLSQRVAPEWFQPDLCSDLTAERVGFEAADSTGLTPEWFQAELRVPSDSTADAVRLEGSSLSEPAPAPEWVQTQARVPSDVSPEPAWLEVPDSTELTAAEVWSLDYEDEITLQSKLAEEVIEDVTEDRFDDWNAINASSQVPISDELLFLPSDAPFAPIPINEETEPGATTLQGASNRDDSITVDRSRVERPRVEVSKVEPPKVERSRVRLLDESDVLQHEQSFATVLEDQPRRKGSYSPQREFLLKTGLSSTQLLLAKLLVVSVICVAALLFLIIFGGVFNSSPRMTDAPRTAVAVPPVNTQPKALTPSSSTASETAAHHRVTSVLPGKEDTKLNASAESARKTSRETVTSKPAVPSKQKEPAVKTPPKEAKSSARDRKSNSTNTAKKRHANEKENVNVRRAANTQTSHSGNVASRIEHKPAASTPRTVAVNARDKPSDPVSGGAQRPRRVTP